ncbi:hypothetical protein GIB67_016219 [Kingdonia uniflora]|uniref:Carbohydrate kinase PfkB domain-containing protein n=1 Tax=Kingdonia uniflora TaxID=39325 RepID=A0A7J7LTC5_9MAGN|nr:hypothetical protein GIB67_016219 [Kingdonia uniflora]
MAEMGEGVWVAARKDDRIVCYGEMLIDFVPTVGEVYLAEALVFKKAAGGVHADIVGISRLEALYSPSWSFRWDNQGHVAGEIENIADRYSHVRRRYAVLEVKSREDADTKAILDGGNPFENLRTPEWQKTLVHETIVGNLTTPVSDKSMGNNFSTQARYLTELSGIADPSSSKLSFSMSESDKHSFSQSYPLPECLENMMFVNEKHDPACLLCISGEKQTLKISEKALRINSWIPRNYVVDGNLEDNSISYGKSSRSKGKCPKIGSSSSVRNVFGKPFLKRHFSLGSRKMISVKENITEIWMQLKEKNSEKKEKERRRLEAMILMMIMWFKRSFSTLTFLLITEGQDGCRYYTMEFKGKIVGVKVNAINTTGHGDTFVSGDLQEMVFEGTRDFDLQRLTKLPFEQFSASAIRPVGKLRVERDIEDFHGLYAVNVVFSVATTVKNKLLHSQRGTIFAWLDILISS